MPRPRRLDKDTVRTSLVLPVALWTRAKMQCVRERRDLRTILTELLENYLRQKEERHGRRP